MSRFHILAVVDNDTSGDDCDGGSMCLLQSVNESLHPVLGNAGMLEATLQVASGGDSMTRTRFHAHRRGLGGFSWRAVGDGIP